MEEERSKRGPSCSEKGAAPGPRCGLEPWEEGPPPG